MPRKGKPTRRLLTISDIAHKQLITWLEQVERGELERYQLPAALQAWFEHAFAAGVERGRRSRDHEVRMLKHEADRLWLQTFSPEDRREYLLDRLDKIGALVAAHPTQPDDFLNEVITHYFTTLDNVREPVVHVSPQTENHSSPKEQGEQIDPFQTSEVA